jgi:hypothetical protein
MANILNTGISKATRGITKASSAVNKGISSVTNPVNKVIGGVAGIANSALTGVGTALTGVSTGPVNKLWRYKIVLHRKTNRGTDANTTYDPANGNYAKIKESSRLNQISYLEKNQIIIYNLMESPYQYIVLQNRPDKIEFKGETTWASIKSMGRNTPMYHYTGSEDTVQFNISWYCDDPDNPEEVLTKCRLLESWTKSDGYSKAPPILFIEWGNSGMFGSKDSDTTQKYILISATYTLMNFNYGYAKSTGSLPSSGKALPRVATQELIFNRVSETNLLTSDIISNDAINKTRGINKS